jgi:predicted GIY-YIG superfamily endonuclease
MASSSDAPRLRLRCADDSLYVGMADDLATRLTRHHEGSASAFTARRRPVVLVYAETHVTREAASQRERQIKRWSRAKKEALIAGDLAMLKAL